MERPKKTHVLLLNVDKYTAIKMIPFEAALSNVISGKYLIHVALKDEYAYGPMQPDGSRFQVAWPVSVYVNRWVPQSFKDVAPRDTVMATRMAILHRDQFTCQYCGDPAATWDHLQPKSRGGQNTWLNLVTACQRCNGFKANRNCQEAEDYLMQCLFDPNISEEDKKKLPPRMTPMREPYVPDHDPYRRAVKDVWKMLKTGEGVDLSEE